MCEVWLLCYHDKHAKSRINLSEPTKLTEYLLRLKPGCTADKIAYDMNNCKETYVSLKNALPFIITYYTAWVEENGLPNFRNNIYGYDALLQNKMFLNIL